MMRLRQVLARRLARWRESAALSAEERDALVEEVAAEMAALDLVNDQRFARERTMALLRRGLGPPVIRSRLRALGLSAGDVEDALRAVLGGEGDRGCAAALVEAALAYARRRRLGPFARGREKRPDPHSRARALAAFQRRGLPLALARIILAAPDERTLLETLVAHGLHSPGPDEG